MNHHVHCPHIKRGLRQAADILERFVRGLQALEADARRFIRLCCEQVPDACEIGILAADLYRGHSEIVDTLPTTQILMELLGRGLAGYLGEPLAQMIADLEKNLSGRDPS